MERLALFILLVGVVYGQTKYCCFPSKWEATEGIMAGSSDDKGNSAVTLGNIKVSFDAEGQQVHLDEDLITGNDTRKIVILQLYKQKVQYIISENKCVRGELGQWNSPNCIPDTATVVGSGYIGYMQNISLTDYTWQVDDRVYTISVTDQCIPVFESVRGTISGENMFAATGFQGLTPGVSDPSIFDIPDICKSADIIDTIPHDVYRRSVFH